MINASFSLFIIPLSTAIRKSLYPSAHANDALRISLVIYLYPVAAFFYALFYTDTMSLLTLLATYYLVILKRKQYLLSAAPSLDILIFVISFLAVLFRQTNAVWLMFIVGTEWVECLIDSKDIPSLTEQSEFSPGRLLTKFIVKTIQQFSSLLVKFISIFLNVVGFVVFVYFNGGIVVGIS